MHYVYLLQSDANQAQATARRHNAGKSPHTSKHLPWKLVTYIAFSDERKAEIFERYLKSGSGHAFAQKRLW